MRAHIRNTQAGFAPYRDREHRVGLAELLGDLPCPPIPDDLEPAFAWVRLECLAEDGKVSWISYMSEDIPARILLTLLLDQRDICVRQDTWSHVGSGYATTGARPPSPATTASPRLDWLDFAAPPPSMLLTGRFLILVMDEVDETHMLQEVRHVWLSQGLEPQEETGLLDTAVEEMAWALSYDTDRTATEAAAKNTTHSEATTTDSRSAGKDAVDATAAEVHGPSTTLGAVLKDFRFPDLLNYIAQDPELRIGAALVLVKAATTDESGSQRRRWFQVWTERASTLRALGALQAQAESLRRGWRLSRAEAQEELYRALDDDDILFTQTPREAPNHQEPDVAEPRDDLGCLAPVAGPLSERLDAETAALSCTGLPEGWRPVAALMFPQFLVGDDPSEAPLCIAAQDVQAAGPSFSVDPLETHGLILSVIRNLCEHEAAMFGMPG